MQFVWGYTMPLILEAAVKNRVFDVLDDGPKTIPELSAATGASERGLRAIANALVGFDFLAKDPEQRYRLTPESAAFLVSTKPAFQGGLLTHISSQLIPTWLPLAEVVRTGLPAHAVNEEAYGSPFFRAFVESLFAMNWPSAHVLGQILPALVPDDAETIRVLDLAAGSGVWGIALAKADPRVTITAVDWEGVLPVTRLVAERHGVGHRIHFVAGDLLEVGFGAGVHVATLGHILHSEGEERSRALLARVYEALVPGGTIAIAEFTPNEDRTGPPMPLIFAVNMLVATDQGDTFTFGEVSRWLTDAGFVQPRLQPVPAPSPLILATKPAHT